MRLGASLLVSVVLVVGLVFADRHRRLLLASGGSLALLAVSWVLAALAVRTDYRDADGFVDCWPGCSTFQDAVGVTLFYGPVAGALVLVTSIALLLVRRGRSGGAR
jgi:hypothetical protein